ncbi:uncharacterized protein LOC122025253 isoform X2 [Zingiber officinale]|uniref:uncharacterized protein LOC122024053 isoform X2 n=1 Tax=Zingiber officinale TaxID=94328 RepID=UPI001C4A8E10|nr:uncharacterized protein LOC122024053 isoform X2 [Zingiber officinale]XP_042439969.1 uncharacterized protein LOC122025253 isoform X2 [Zingiber officinale]XP_042439970.1 uncharacterized protein LOC122025253 isoform X2 [Zingiber officinale]
MVERDLVVASAGDDKKISLWNKNGQSMGSFPSHGSDLADDIEESKTQLLIWCHAKNIHSCYVGYNNSAKCILRWTPSHFSNCCQCLGQCHSCFYFLIGNCTEDGKAQLEDCKAIFCITGSLIFTFWKGHFVGGLCYFTYDPTSFRKS